MNKIIPEYNYSYFDQWNQLQTMPLNIFQCFARKAFGCYKETHLKTVVQQAYTVTLNGDFHGNSKKQQQLMQLFEKIQTIYGSRKNSFKLPSIDNMKLSVSYVLNDSASLKCINFTLKFRGKKLSIDIFKNKSNQITARLPGKIFDVYANDTETEIQLTFSRTAKTINNLLAKILNDSSAQSEMAQIRCYANDLQWSMNNSRHSELPPGFDHSKASKLELTRADQMRASGWESLGPYQKKEKYSYGDRVVDQKQVFRLKRENVEKNRELSNQGFHQNLSLAFASSLLAAQDREY